MNFGIPFKSPFGRPFGVPFLGVGGGITPPTGFVAKYSAFDPNDFSLVTGNSVNVWDDKTGVNNLTQGTSVNQPSLIENVNPALNKVEFDANDFMEGLPPQAGDFTYVFTGLDYDNTGTTRFLTEANSLAERFYFQQNNGGQWVAKDVGGGFHIIGTPILKYSELVFKKEGAVLSLYGNGVLVGNFSGDVTGDTFNILRIGNSSNSINGSLQELYVYDRALTQEEIDYFSYLRDENGNILLPPLLPS